MDNIIPFLLFLAPALASAAQISTFEKGRDYLSVTSENYPESYPGPDSWKWQWTVDSGHWAVVFLDFHLDCNHDDMLVISDLGRNLTFSCESGPKERYAYVIRGPKFTIHLHSYGQGGSQLTRGFKCQVLYGADRGKLQSKIDDMKTSGQTPVPDTTEDSSPFHTNIIIIVLLLLIVPLVIIIVIGGVMMVRRRHLQQSTNTSVHLNIGAIRRDSSVSYTRNGNGPPPGARSRLDSESSLSPESSTRPKRPVKRSESNASWAMRAEMTTSVRNGSCSSEGHHGGTAVSNVYGPCPGESGLLELDPQDLKTAHKDLAVGCRLSTICEERSSIISSSSNSKLNASFPVPVQCHEPSLAIANAGYMLMTSCSADYVNCGHD